MPPQNEFHGITNSWTHLFFHVSFTVILSVFEYTMLYAVGFDSLSELSTVATVQYASYMRASFLIFLFILHYILYPVVFLLTIQHFAYILS